MDVSNPGGSFRCRVFFVHIKCKYATPTAKAHVFGHPTSKVVATKVPLSEQEPKSGFCPDTAEWDYEAALTPNDLSVHLL